jgi:hypothetical protein
MEGKRTTIYFAFITSLSTQFGCQQEHFLEYCAIDFEQLVVEKGEREIADRNGIFVPFTYRRTNTTRVQTRTIPYVVRHSVRLACA